MIEDDLPALVGFFEDQGEEAFCVAPFFFAAVELVFSDADGEFLVEGVDFDVGEGECSHGGFVGIVAAVLIEEASEAVVDLGGDEEGVGRVFVGFGEGVEVSIVPGVFLGDEDLDDVELLPGGGVEGIDGAWILRVEGNGAEGEVSCQYEDWEAGATAKAWQHGEYLGLGFILWGSVGRFNDGRFAG